MSQKTAKKSIEEEEDEVGVEKGESKAKPEIID